MTPGGKAELRKRFSSDWQALEHQLGADIRSAEELTRLGPGAHQKASFKVTLQDGRIVKLRRFKSALDWSSAVALSPYLEQLNFSRLLFAHGMASIEQWIPGTCPGSATLSQHQIAQAGDLLGQLHSIGGLPVMAQTRQSDIASYLDGINAHLASLVEYSLLDTTPARKLYEAACRAQPTRFETGLIHGDFCADNMVLTEGGEIVMVDNESVRLGELDYDIARCWSRWPMTDAQRAAFVAGYQHHRGMAEFDRHRDFWAIKALAQTICVRAQYRKPYQSALDALHRIANGNEGEPWPQPG